MKPFNFLKMACGLFLFCAAATIPLTAQTLTTLGTFDGINGELPAYASLVQNTNGDIYGVTYLGGTNGAGTIFQITAEGAFTTLYSFCSQSNCADGGFPYAGLAHDNAGNLYGTASNLGANFYGTVFKITPAGALTTLYNFCSQANCADGAYPYAGLLYLGGNFYGTTSSGGANNAGTIFKITPAGLLTTLYSFCSQPNCADGEFAFDAMIAANGKLWGTTQEGGANGFGTIFSVTTAGALTTLHSFTDGAVALGGLVHAANGDFYGTTETGGSRDDGTVFKMTATGTFNTIYNFCAAIDCPDGVSPFGGLALGSNGSFYGTTAAGGSNFRGTIFEITQAGKITTLYNFCSITGCSDGQYPYSGLLRASSGDLYGTTQQGGDLSCNSPNGCGTVFSFLP